MGVGERDYSRSDSRRADRGVYGSPYLPPRGALALVILHVLGFLLVLAARHDAGHVAPRMFALNGATSHPAGIVLHPIGSGSLFTLVLVVCVIWMLGGRVEARFGTGRLLYVYALGTLFAGAVYFSFAQMAPDLARQSLAAPAGALAAWALAAWRNLQDDVVSVFGRSVTVAKAAAIGTAIVAGWVFFRYGPEATGWLIAAAAGALAWPALALVCDRIDLDGRRRRGNDGGIVKRLEGSASENQTVPEDLEIDDILAKIGREGIGSLTREEREQLEVARQARLRRTR